MKIIGKKKNSKYWSPSCIMIVNHGSRLWHMAQKKIYHMAY